MRSIACADWPARTKASLLSRVATTQERSLRDENNKGGENENPFRTSLNRCNATSVNEPPDRSPFSCVIRANELLVYQSVTTALDRSSKFLFSSLLHNYSPFPFMRETRSWSKVSHSLNDVCTLLCVEPISETGIFLCFQRNVSKETRLRNEKK